MNCRYLMPVLALFVSTAHTTAYAQIGGWRPYASPPAYAYAPIQLAYARPVYYSYPHQPRRPITPPDGKRDTGTPAQPAPATASGTRAPHSQVHSGLNIATERDLTDLAEDAGPERISSRLPAALRDRSMPVTDRKKQFVKIVLPLIKAENRSILVTRKRLLKLRNKLASEEELNSEERAWLTQLLEKYQLPGNIETPGALKALSQRVDIVPVSLALSQSAHETAWGRSRFAHEARNLFGIWTYDETAGLVPKRREQGKKHLVRHFASLRESVTYYVHMLNTHKAYQSLRDERAALRAADQPLTGWKLAAGLNLYSARGNDYIDDIRATINGNRFDNYDNTQS